MTQRDAQQLLGQALVDALLGRAGSVGVTVTRAADTMLVEKFAVDAAVLANREPNVEGYLISAVGTSISGHPMRIDLILPRESKAQFMADLELAHFPEEPCRHKESPAKDFWPEDKPGRSGG